MQTERTAGLPEPPRSTGFAAESVTPLPPAPASGSHAVALRILVTGGATAAFGSLLSWNHVDLGPLVFAGRVGIHGGTSLGFLVMGILVAFSSLRALRDPAVAVRRTHGRAAWASVAGAAQICWGGFYVGGLRTEFIAWVRGATEQATLAAQFHIPAPVVHAQIEAAVASGAVRVTLQPGFYLAMGGAAIVVLGGIIELLVVRARARTGV